MNRDAGSHIGQYSHPNDTDIIKKKHYEIIGKYLDLETDSDNIKKAFVLSFYFLLRYQDCLSETGYEDSIRITLQQKSPDNNRSYATVVGGMLGALHGVKLMPESVINELL